MREAVAAAAAQARNGNFGGKEVSGAAAQRRDAAVAVAAVAVLQHLYRDQRESLETRLAVSFSRSPETAAKVEGAAIGRRVANEFKAVAGLAAGRRSACSSARCTAMVLVRRASHTPKVGVRPIRGVPYWIDSACRRAV